MWFDDKRACKDEAQLPAVSKVSNFVDASGATNVRLANVLIQQR